MTTMHPPRLYCPSLATGIVTLSPEESHHAISVLRLRVGSEVKLFDGAGREAAGRVSRAARKTATVEVADVPQASARRRGVQLTLAVAMPRAHRQGFLIEKCTELGAAAIWPLITDRGVAKPSKTNAEKWRRRAVEAAKQSGQLWLPNIANPLSTGDALERADGFVARGWADTASQATPVTSFYEPLTGATRVIVFVGPEGGWSPAEREQADRCGVTPIALAPCVLRTETAALAVCAIAAGHAVASDQTP